MRCPFGTASVVSVSVVCCGRDYSLVSENRPRWRHSSFFFHPAGVSHCWSLQDVGSVFILQALFKGMTSEQRENLIKKTKSLSYQQEGTIWDQCNAFCDICSVILPNSTAQPISHLLFSGMWLFGPEMSQATFWATFQGKAPSCSGLQGPEVRNVVIYNRICKLAVCCVSVCEFFISTSLSSEVQHNPLVIKMFLDLIWLLRRISEQHDRSTYLPASTANGKI